MDAINRAFQVVDPKDHKFQTQVYMIHMKITYIINHIVLQIMDMCIAALPAAYDDKVLGLYNQWIKMFPCNKKLVCR